MNRDRAAAGNLKDRIRQNKITQLCVGPVSKNCTDATIEIANEYRIPLVLIASRRQIDSDEFGGGYVNGWSTRQFADYVKEKDRGGYVILARDHGGPWQNTSEVEKQLSAEEAMESAKRSFFEDIDAGFSLLHIDPSIDIHEVPERDVILNRVFELYSACSDYASEKNRIIDFEIGTEEQSGLLASPDDFSQLLQQVNHFCRENQYDPPLFAVAQTGTRVMEMQNIGELQIRTQQGEDLSGIHEIVSEVTRLCEQNGLLLKAHNGDYLSDRAVEIHPEIGVHALNVAPEFGVHESVVLSELFRSYGLVREEESFLELAYSSGKWKKWMLQPTQATDRERALISGHYIFASAEFKILIDTLSRAMAKDHLDPDRVLTDAIKSKIKRYLFGLGMVKQ